MPSLILAIFLALSFPAHASDDEHEGGECEHGHGCMSVPEMDGRALPGALILLACLYVVASARARKRGN